MIKEKVVHFEQGNQLAKENLIHALQIPDKPFPYNDNVKYSTIQFQDDKAFHTDLDFFKFQRKLHLSFTKFGPAAVSASIDQLTLACFGTA